MDELANEEYDMENQSQPIGVVESARIRMRAEGSRGLVEVGSHYVRVGLGVSGRA